MEEDKNISEIKQTVIKSDSLSQILKKSKGIIPEIYTNNIKEFLKFRKNENEMTIVTKRANIVERGSEFENDFAKKTPIKIQNFNNSLIIKNPILGGKSLLKIAQKSHINIRTHSLPKLEKIKVKVKKLNLNAKEKNWENSKKENLKITKEEMKKLLEVIDSEGFMNTSNKELIGRKSKGENSCKIELTPIIQKKSFRSHSFRSKDQINSLRNMNTSSFRSYANENLKGSITLKNVKIYERMKKPKRVKKSNLRTILFNKNTKMKKKNRLIQNKCLNKENLKKYRKKYPREKTEESKEKTEFYFTHQREKKKEKAYELLTCKKIKLTENLKEEKKKVKSNRRKKSERKIRLGNQGFRYFDLNFRKEGGISDFKALDFGVKGSKIAEWDRMSFGLKTEFSNSVFGVGGERNED